MAGRIPQHFIDDLLARVNIIDVLDGRVSKLKRTGKNYSGLCPFHKEKTPSFTANPEKQFYYCFGCGAGGNALGFLMEYDRLDFPDAIEELAKMVGMEVPRETSSPQQQQRDQQLKDIYALLEDASQYYCDQLRQHPARSAAVNYLKQRGMSGQIAKQFRIGLAPPGWDNLLNQLGPDDKQRALLEKAGLLIRNEERGSLYDRFRERIMFPIRDQRGRVIAFGGRVLGDAKPKYLNSPETDTFHKSRELYGLYEARQHNSKLERLIIVEGYMDVIGLAQYGITYAVATLGTATTAQHLERLFKMVREVVFCFDGDEAGRNAARRALETTLPVISDGKEARFLFLPEGEDPDSLVRKEGPDAFQQRMNGALPLSSFFFQTLQRDIDLDHLDGRARFSREALPLIGAMQPSILRQMMLNQVQQLTGLSEQQLEELQQHSQPTTPAPAPAASPPTIDELTPAADYDYPAHDPGFPVDEMSHDGPPEYYSDSQHAPEQNRWKKRNDWQRRGNWQPRERQQPKQPPRRAPQLCHSMNAMLLHYPALATAIDNPGQYRTLDEPGIELFCSLCEYLQQHPQANLGMLLVDWSSDPDRFHWIQTVNAITESGPMEDHHTAEQTLRDGLRKLDELRLRQRINELRNKKPLTSDEKTELTALLMRKARPHQP
ncbi:DNA primase [Marinobacterium arenosum]|uniref:DNA primase n=1 Tax=Marinobacterium arenosum TaxID=2862496 RepID=UPI001C96CA39|nr:DNA primase [Marinobacterium arenosum]MBY4676058.1 DNA primase [Marinobacterium arenosum]